jgi:osmotically-inducible protein OsmY
MAAMSRAVKKTDWDLRDDVIRELAWDQRVDAKHVAVQASEGVVTLAGTVESWLARNAAVEAAHRVAGVRDVANELEARPTDGTLTDADIAHAARQALEKDALAPADLVHVTVAHGEIKLRGTVETLTERAEAEHAVERLRGIRRVVNEIQVSPGLDSSGVKEAIESALARQSARETAHLQISLTDGRVVVEGIVRSTAERRAILGAIHGTRGVAGVDDRLVVQA